MLREATFPARDGRLPGELPLQPVLHRAARSPGEWRARRQAIEAVRRTRVDVQLGGHVGVGQAERVVHVLIEEAIERAHYDEGGREPGEVVRARGGRVRGDIAA